MYFRYTPRTAFNSIVLRPILHTSGRSGVIRIFTVSTIIPDVPICQRNPRVCPLCHFYVPSVFFSHKSKWHKGQTGGLGPSKNNHPWPLTSLTAQIWSFGIIVRSDRLTLLKSGVHRENRNAPVSSVNWETLFVTNHPRWSGIYLQFLVFVRSATSVIIEEQWNLLSSGILPTNEKCQA